MAEEKAKKKKPTALKRDIQNNKKQLRNKAHKSKIKTAMRSFATAIETKEKQEHLQEKINVAYSLIDKAVKKNIFQKNKAARVKSRLSSFMKEALKAS